MDSDWKPGGAGIIYFWSVSGKIKKLGFNSMGRWSDQLFKGGNNIHSVIFIIYNYCKTPSKRGEDNSSLQTRTDVI